MKKSRRLVRCPSCLTKGCLFCDGDGFVYADSKQASHLALVPEISHVPVIPIAEDLNEAENALALLAEERYSLTVWKQKVEQRIVELEGQLLREMAETGLDQAYGPNGIGYCRVKKWITIENSPYILRQIGKLQKVDD